VSILYNHRLAIKKTNPVEGDAVKLILNSLYGKTISRDIEETVEIMEEDEIHRKYDNTFTGIQ
jgi:hypothetical protein